MNPFARPAHARALVALSLLAVMGALSPMTLASQTLPVGASEEEYLRLLQVAGLATAGSFNVRPFVTFEGIPDSVAHPWRARLGIRGSSGAASPRVTLDPVGVRLVANSGYPNGGNDGAIWAGKGLTGALDAGVTLEWKHLSATLHPVAWYAQNASFVLAPVARSGAPQYAYPWRIIDLPQRFGPGRVTIVDPGQSTVRLTVGSVTAGFGTENLWWGPGIHSSILMSDNAAGFPHGMLATSRPVDVKIAMLEAQWIWGRLQDSGWLDAVATSRHGRFLTGAVVSLTFKRLEGLSLGMARVFTAMVPDAGLDRGEYLLIFQRTSKQSFQSTENPEGSDKRDQMVSFFARWVIPGGGFEAYGEWARNDHGVHLRDYLLEPEHAQAYTLGFQKTLSLTGERILVLGGELTHLERAPTFQVRDEPIFYAHHLVLPGYTQRGQVIGSALGPGGNGQHLSVDVYSSWGRAGAFLLRQVHDNDAYWVDALREGKGNCCHDVTAGGGGRVTAFVHDLELSGSGTLTRELNRYFDHRNDVWNVNLALSATWRP